MWTKMSPAAQQETLRDALEKRISQAAATLDGNDQRFPDRG